MAMRVALAVCSCMLLASSAAAQQDASTIVNAIADQAVHTIALDEDISLMDDAELLNTMAGGGRKPYTLERSLTISGKEGAAKPVLDLAYESSLLKLAPGTTLTFRDLKLVRAEVGCPLAAVSDSPGASIVYDGTISWLEVCPPALYAQAMFRSAQQANEGFSMDGNTWHLHGVSLDVPLVGNGLGGYTAHWRNGAQIQCGTMLELPVECQDLTALSMSISSECQAAVQGAMRRKLCQRQATCINGCWLANCSKRSRYQNYARRH